MSIREGLHEMAVALERENVRPEGAITVRLAHDDYLTLLSELKLGVERGPAFTFQPSCWVQIDVRCKS